MISAFTATGLATARKLYARHRVVPLPVDLSFVVARFLRCFNPRLLVVAESEFWPNLIGLAHARGVPAVLVNGKMSAKSFRVHARTRLVPRVLAKFAVLAVQTEEHAQRLQALGVPRARLHVTGNMKYDLTQPAAAASSAPSSCVRRSATSPPTSSSSAAACTISEDEALLDAYAAARAGVAEAALVIVPRYPADADAVEQRAQARGFAVTRKTAVDAGAARGARARAACSSSTRSASSARLYAVADLAFVGGSLFFRGANKGGHNLMEPAIFGVPVLFGPYNFSFKETVDDLLAADAGRLVHDAAELRAAVVALVADRDARRALGSRAQRVVEAGPRRDGTQLRAARGAAARAALSLATRRPWPQNAAVL